MSTTPAPRLTTRQASDYLLARHGVTVAPATLTKRRCVGGGPAFVRMLRAVYYAPAELDKWVDTQITASLRSTSDLAAQR